MSTAAPPIDTHLRRRGALLRSHPVAPPINRIGDSAVPTPKSTAKAILSTGEANGI